MTIARHNWVTHANKLNSEIPVKRTVGAAQGKIPVMIGFSCRDAENPIHFVKMQSATAAGNILEVVSRTWRSTSQSSRSANKILPPGRLALACCSEFLLDRSGENPSTYGNVVFAVRTASCELFRGCTEKAINQESCHDAERKIYF